MEPQVALLMGSESDRPTLQKTADMLQSLKISYEWRVISAHRNPALLHDYVSDAEARGVRVFVAAAGGAAHLAGVVASITSMPVLAVPIKTSSLGGLDSLLSMVQMPKGVPVATFAIGEAGAANAAIFAAQIIGVANETTAVAVMAFRREQTEKLAADCEKSAVNFRAD